MAHHPPEFADTDPRAMQVWIELLRRMRPREKFAAALELTNLAFRAAEAGERLTDPSADDREIFLRAASRRLPREWMIRAYGWDPGSNGISS